MYPKFFKKITLFLLLAYPALSQAQAFQHGLFAASTGYGFPNMNVALVNFFGDYSNYTIQGIGPAHVKLEYGVSDHFGLGISVNYAGFNLSYKRYGYNYQLTWNSIKFNVRANYHFGKMEKFDPYVGMGIGYGIATFHLTDDDPYSTEELVRNPFPLGLEATLGARYFLTKEIGIYSELGMAKSIIQAGIVFGISTIKSNKSSSPSLF